MSVFSGSYPKWNEYKINIIEFLVSGFGFCLITPHPDY